MWSSACVCVRQVLQIKAGGQGEGAGGCCMAVHVVARVLTHVRMT